LPRLFLQFAFAYWTGNGDLHLKNLSLLERSEVPSSYALSPAYDLLCTLLVLPRDRMALLLNGRTQDVKRRDYLALASRCGLSAAQADAVLDGLISLLPRAEELVERSFLPGPQKTLYLRVLRKRSRALRAD
jgi:serine/threonine-protein kinase HipA